MVGRTAKLPLGYLMDAYFGKNLRGVQSRSLQDEQRIQALVDILSLPPVPHCYPLERSQNDQRTSKGTQIQPPGLLSNRPYQE